LATFFESAEDGRFNFHVEIGHPLTGLIVRYRADGSFRAFEDRAGRSARTFCSATNVQRTPNMVTACAVGNISHRAR
jgi:hypothetical protein